MFMAHEGGKSQSARLVAFLAFTVMFLPVAQASILSVGGTAPPSPLFPSGPTMASTSGTITTPTFTDTYNTWVQADPNNTFCANCLDFIYTFTNLGPAVNQRFSMSSFAGFMVDLGTNPFGVHDPITVSRSLTTGGPVLSFNFDQFGDGINPGETTVDLIVETNALKYTTGYLSAQDGTAGSGVGFQPMSSVPEPTSLMLMGSGLLALGSFLRKSRAR
ncbi:MAG: PEP-CTERM sorting domain-containing protein [Candidatus Korobacteraceae bacterium]